MRPLLAALAALAMVAGTLSLPSPAGAKQGAPMMARLIVDLEDSLTRETLAAYQEAFSEVGAKVRWRFHHLPLRRHKQAETAALAALAARKQGKETAFLQALLAKSSLDDAALRAAAQQAQVDAKRWQEDRSSKAVADLLIAERKALVALGVRATPSAILNGRGLAGLPPRRALLAAVGAIWSDAADCLRRMGPRSCESANAKKHGGGAALAFEALASGAPLGGQDVVTRPIGRLGDRYKVKLSKWDARIGKASADVTIVAFIDPGDARQRQAVASLSTLARQQRDRLVVKLLPRARHAGGPASGLHTALGLTAIGLRAKEKGRAAMLDAIASGKPWPTILPGLSAAVGLVGGALQEAIAAPETTVALDETLKVAQQVDARPGSVYINGRVWMGRADDHGLDQVLELARGEAWNARKTGVARKKVYRSLIATGRVKSPAESDLDDHEDLGELAAIPDLGTAAAEAIEPLDVYLFVDFRSLASRAAFHILRGLREHPKHPIRLHMASMASSAEPAVTASGAVFVAANRLGRGLMAAKRLFGLTDPNDWRYLRKMWRSLGLSKKVLQAHVTHAGTKACSDTMERLVKVFEMDRDPVIYIANRRYIGPIDESRLLRTIAFSHAEANSKEDN